MAENWIEKAAEEITKDRMMGAGADKWIAAIILSHAPVIDAEKLAKKIDYEFDVSGGNQMNSDACVRQLAQLITSNLDLKVDWVDGKAEWGRFQLYLAEEGIWKWWLKTEGDKGRGTWLTTILDSGEAPTKENCQAACVDALKRIVTGVKECG